MAARRTSQWTYSRWDGTQKGFELDADSVFDALTDDLLYHGDVNSALRRMMQDGFKDRNGEQLQGLREIMERLRRERQERLDNSDLGGVYSEIAEAPASKRSWACTPATPREARWKTATA